MTKKNSLIQPWLIALLIGIITFIILSPSLKGDFVFDDTGYIVGNPLVVSKTIEAKKIFTSVAAKEDYYPITMLTLAWNYHQGKLDTTGYHLGNLLLHILNTLLVFLFIFLITNRNLLMATIVSFFFGIHPMHVESVAWITERKDVLFLFFFLSGLITYLRFRDSKKIVWYFITLFLFILSCLSKGTAVVFPFILILTDYLLQKEINKKAIFDKIPFLVLSFLFMFITFKLHQNSASNEVLFRISFFHRILSASFQLLMYTLKLIIPFNLSVFYQNPDENNLSFIFYISPFILIGAAFALFYFLRKEKEIIFGVMFFVISIALMLQLIPTGKGNFIMADRYTYLPSIGLFFVIAYIMNLVWTNKTGKFHSLKNPFAFILIISALVYSFQTYSRTKVWRNGETLWTDAIEKDPTASVAYYSRGIYRTLQNQNQLAMDDYNKAIALAPRFADVYNNRGILNNKLGNNEAALADYTAALNINPKYTDAYYNRGVLYNMSGNIEAALADFNKTISLDSSKADVFDSRGYIYFQMKKTDLALSDYKKAIALNPDYADTYNNLGWLYTSSGNSQLAIVNYNKVLAIQPDFFKARYNRACEKVKLNDCKSALEDWNYMLNQYPKENQLYYNRAMTFLKINDTANACSDLKTSEELGNKNASNIRNKFCH